MVDAPSQTQDKFIIRLPNGLRERIKVKSDENGRSMNAEIVQLLEREYPEPKAQQIVEQAILKKLGDMPQEERDEKMRAILDLLGCDIK